MKKALLSILILFFSFSTQSKNYQYIFDRYTIREGLPSNHIYDIIQDDHGFLWISTENGLSRFDGYSFLQIKPQNTQSKIKTDIYQMQYHHDTLWLGTKNGLQYLSLRDLNYQKNVLNSKGSISSLFLNDNNLWLGYSDGEVYRYNRSNLQNDNFFSLPDQANGIRSFYTCKNGKILVTAGNKLIQISNDPHEKSLKILRNLSGRVLLFDLKENGVWLSNQNTLYRIIETIHGVQFLKAKMNLTASSIHSMTSDSKDNIWIGTDIGLYNAKITNLNQISLSKIPIWKDMPDARTKIKKVFVDNSGTLWACSFNEGLFKLNTQESNIIQFHRLSDKCPESNDVKVISKNSKGNLLLGTRRDGITEWKDKNVIHHLNRTLENKHNIALEDNAITFIHPEGDNFWLGTYSSIIQMSSDYELLNIIKSRKKRMPYNIPGPITSFLKDYQGEFWVGTQRGMFRINQNTNNVTAYNNQSDKNHKITGDDINKIIEDKYGNIWVATKESGLNKISPERKTILHFTENNQYLSSNNIFDIYDGKECIYIATDLGIDIIKEDQKIASINYKNGLPKKSILSVAEDLNSNLWLGTNNGLFMLKSGFLNLLTNGIKLYFQQYLPEYSFSEQAAYLDKHSGKLYFGSDEGLAEVNPESISENYTVLDPLITSFSIFNNKYSRFNDKVVSYMDTLVIDYTENFLTIDFSSPTTNNPINNQFMFKLEPIQKEWIKVDASNRSAAFHGLKPGEYKFLLKSSNENNIWNDTAKEFNITITPPFWKTQAFYLIILFAILILIYLLYFLRVRSLHRRNKRLEEEVEKKLVHIKKQQEEILMQKEDIIVMSQKIHEADMEKLRHYTNISHEFKTPLMLIISPLDRIINDSNLPKSVMQSLKIMRKNCYTLLMLINQLMDIRKKDIGALKLKVTKYNINQLIKNISECFEPLVTEKSISLSIPESNEDMGYFDVKKIEKVIFNLLSNAFKFTPHGGSIIIKYSIKNGILSLKILDTGCGVKDEEKTKIFERFYKTEGNTNHMGSGIGLSLVKEYINAHHGSITITDNSPKGSVFTICFPLLKKSYEREDVIFKSHKSSDYQYYHEGINLLKESDEPIQLTAIDNKVSQLILVVEDNDDLRFFIKDILVEAGYQVLEARNGIEAIEVTKKHIPDMIISDLMMPKMDGLELCEYMKKQLITCHIPFIILTAKTGEVDLLKGLNYGADDYIAKPFNFKILLAKIRSILQNRIILKERVSDSNTNPLIDENTSGKDQKLINDMIEYVKSNLNNPELSVESLSSEMGMSRSNLYRKVKELTGISVSEFIRNIRLKTSCELILQKELNISEIAYQIGFESATSFRRIFKKYYGCSPSEYGKNK
ncbi:response regulator [Aureibacter tunicatorum]|uniref:histidine kinase n=1 Tax=Aureibacter tunicatorum TaxID=866807 RepID=A0AAE3XTM3_9BACT|nr:response regulator [Aureibacter tunicatorum]MDR6241769.1 signal transduction histidine kinase/ligand-binding sensor domain-containing protein/CheY-like chemotaxis protein [Aureibacter tunicatorum]BDD07439.1 hybrid sensor histidine kinase/response regulator [Aureibacter tunicatorum]